MRLIAERGFLHESRNGPVYVMSEPVTTHYLFPTNRVLFNERRDANPFFHLFEAMWMLTGGNDVSSMVYFVKQIAEYSDDGITFHGAYGHRWRHWEPDEPTEHAYSDQLENIIAILKRNPDDRRVILQMWDPKRDLNRSGKDFPCNVTAKFEIGLNRALNMIVFNRSNDIIWGAYGANAVHFSFLQEYIAARVGVPVGWYEQISTNYHAYKDVFDKLYPVVVGIRPTCRNVELVSNPDTFDREVTEMMDMMHMHRHIPIRVADKWENNFLRDICVPMADAYLEFRTLKSKRAIEILNTAINEHDSVDWLVAGLRWMQRRNLTNIG
jgi:thymidylate synthase